PAGLLPGPRPLPAADLVNARRRRVVTVGHPPLDEIDAMHRHPQQLAAGVLDDERLEDLLADADLLGTAEAADAMVHVDHVVARLERGEALQRDAAAELASAAESTCPPEDLVVGEHTGPWDGVIDDEAAPE